MTLFNNKYRVETTRLKNWDYGSAAPYFITICTINGEHFFGELQNDKMSLNAIGLTVKNEWERTPQIRPDMNLTLNEFVIMPNHFHAIICIGENRFNKNTKDVEGNKFSPQSKNLGAIIGGFKSSVSKKVRAIIPHFGWQERYHDNVIRDDESYLRIQQYILNNPKNWKDDKFYS